MPNTVIALKKSATSTNKPSSLANGELAINFADGILYYKHANGTIASVSGTGGSFNYVGTIDANGTLLVSDTPGDIISIYPGDGITIVGDAISDRMYINATATGSASNAKVFVSNTGPTDNTNGTLWWNSELGRLLVYYSDGDSNQWVEANPVITGSVNDANSSNSYAVTVGAASNTWANTVGTAGNNYAIQVGAASNTWANTKLANSSGTFAGDLTTTGSVTSNGYVYINPTGGQEGGEIQLQATGGNTNWSIDSYQNNIRVFARTGSTVSNANFFHAATGSVRVGVNKSDPLYTLDVAGTANATLVLDSKGDVRDIPLNTQIVTYGLVIGDSGKVVSTNTGVFVPNTVFSSGQTVSVYNNSAASITITQNSSVTMYLGGSATTGNRTLAQRGLASILCVAANTFVISGVGLT